MAVSVILLIWYFETAIRRQEQGVVPANVVEVLRQSPRRAGSAEQLKDPLAAGEGVGGVALLFKYTGDPVAGVGLARRIAEFDEQVHGLAEVVVRLVVASQPGQGAAQPAVGAGLPWAVTVTLRGAQGSAFGEGSTRSSNSG
jgi:hypothetical protein